MKNVLTTLQIVIALWQLKRLADIENTFKSETSTSQAPDKGAAADPLQSLLNAIQVNL